MKGLDREWSAAPRLWLNPALIATAIYHFYFTAWGLRAGFTHDDLMNIGRSIQSPISRILRDNLLFFVPTPLYRPWGELWYRITYEVFGFTPLPYRIGIHALLAMNVALSYRVFQRFGSAKAVALMAALLMSYHPQLQYFLFNTGYAFDLWCYFFYFLAIEVYVAQGNKHPVLRKRDVATVAALGVLALNSKEVAVTLPVVLAAIELSKGGVSTWRRYRTVIVSTVISVAFIVGRVYGPGGMGTIGGRYTTDFTFATFILQSDRLLREYFLLGDAGSRWLVCGVFVSVAMGSLFKKEIVPRLALTLAFIGVLPVVFLDRGLATAYIGMAGISWFVAWTVWTAVAMAGRKAAATTSIASFSIVLIACLILMPPYKFQEEGVFAESRQIASVAEDIRALNLHPPAQARILMLHDPFPGFRWGTTFLSFILLDDSTLTVDWASESASPADQYYVVLDTVQGHLVRAVVK